MGQISGLDPCTVGTEVRVMLLTKRMWKRLRKKCACEGCADYTDRIMGTFVLGVKNGILHTAQSAP